MPGIYFELVGKMIAVAIYNGIILDVKFPNYLWKRLATPAGAPPPPVTLADLADVDPGTHKGLQTLLDYSGDVADFALVFAVDVEVFGEVTSRTLPVLNTKGYVLEY